METVILTFIGEDKPGIIENIAKIVFLHGGSWNDSRFSHMSGQFAGFAKVTVSKKQTALLVSDLRELTGLLVKTTDDTTTDSQYYKTVKLNIVANDRPGIVQEVSRVLAQQQVNVTEFNTQCNSAPNWGGSVFKAKIIVSLPANLENETLLSALETLGDDLILELEF
jgi:glycine cleavage system regulatory protein